MVQALVAPFNGIHCALNESQTSIIVVDFQGGKSIRRKAINQQEKHVTCSSITSGFFAVKRFKLVLTKVI